MTDTTEALAAELAPLRPAIRMALSNEQIDMAIAASRVPAQALAAEQGEGVTMDKDGECNP